MKIVEVKILNSKFKLACEEGQESKLLAIAEEFNRKATNIAKNQPSAPDGLIVVMAALMLQDQISSANHEENIEDSITEIFDSITTRINNLTKSL